MPKYNVRRKAQLGLDIREGGIAIPIAPNMYYMDGRSHDNGGIAIGPNNKNGLEVEGGEVVKVGKNDVKVFSSVPLLRGVSPAQLVMGGANPNKVFAAQEEFKDKNRINDDGTRYEVGGEKRIYTPNKSIQRQIQETGKVIIGGAPTIGGLRTAKYVKGLATAKGYVKQANKIFTKVDNFVNNSLQGLINKHKITPNQADAYKKFYNEIVGVNGVNIPKTISIFVNNENKEMRYGGRIKAPWGLEAPIEGGYYPESSEPQTIKWLSDWLNGRRAQLYENAASSPSHNFYYSKPFDEIRGLSKGISGSRLQTNRVFYSLINNAASATHKIGDTVSSIASGQYDKKANEITYPNSSIDMNSSIHERTHAMKSKPQTVKIKTILGDRYKQPWGEPDSNSMTAPLVQYMNQYLSDPEEVYSRIMEYRYNSKLKPSDKVDVNQLNNNRELLKTLNLHYISDEDLMNLFNNVAANKDNKVKAKYGCNMIYEINGNVRNGLSLRSKAKYGTIDKKDKDVKVGQDGLIYKRAADGEWYTDGTKHVAFKEIENSTRTARRDIFKASDVDKLDALVDENDKFISTSSSIPTVGKKINLKLLKPKRTYVGGYDEEEKETKKISSLTYEKNEYGKWVPSAKQSTTTTRDGGRPKDFGMTRTGVNHPNGNYKYHPLTGEKISEIGVVETSEPSVKGTAKVTSKLSSTPRGRGTTSASSASSRGTAKVESPKPATATNPMEARYASRVQKGQAQEVTPKPVTTYDESADKNPDKYRYTRNVGVKASKSPSSTGGGTQSKDGRWIGQYKTTNVGDWIGLGSNLAGSVASYFMTKNTINKMPEPLKPVMTPAVKLKTKYNIQPQLTNINETEQMNRASVRRNTQSSNTSLAREQRLMNEARGTKNTLYGQKENIETQLINKDRLNRQAVMMENVNKYNDYLNRLTGTRQAKNQLKVSNINNLLSGLTSSVNNILGTIESRRATNNTLRAIAAANPNVDARLIGGFDYYIDPITKKKYNKNQQYVGTING